MSGLKVCMFVYNFFRPDVRVLKEAHSLSQAGYEVRVIAVLGKDLQEIQNFEDVKVIRVVKNPVHYRFRKLFMQFKLNSRRLRRRIKVKLLRPIIRTTLKPFYFLINAMSRLESKYELHESQEDSSLGFGSILGIGLVLLIKISKLFKKLISKTIHILRFILNQLKGLIAGMLEHGFRLVKRGLIMLRLNNFATEIFKLFSFIDYYQRSFEIITQEPADYYHAHDFNTLPVAWWAKRKLGGKLIYDSHELYTETSTISKTEARFSEFAERRMITSCDTVITVCDSIARELNERYRVETPEVLLNCPLKYMEFQPQNRFRDLLGIPTDVPIVLYQGGFSKNRGLHNLVRASRYFLKGKLILMGWGSIEQELRRTVSEEGLDDYIYFVEAVPQDELLYWTSSADIGVIPYQKVGLNNYYSCPNKLFEYIQAGLPIAGSCFPEISKILTENSIGKTFDPEIPESIAESINSILANKVKYELMRKNVFEASEKYSWERESEKLLNQYALLKT